MKLRILTRGGYPGLSGWTPYNHKVLKEAGESETEVDVMMEAEV